MSRALPWPSGSLNTNTEFPVSPVSIRASLSALEATMKAASPRFVVVNICEDSILYRLSELPFESSAVLVVQGVYCDALHLAALSAIVAKVRYLCMLYTPSANPPSQSYLAVKPAESKIVPVEAGQELTGGWVINKA